MLACALNFSISVSLVLVYCMGVVWSVAAILKKGRVNYKDVWKEEGLRRGGRDDQGELLMIHIIYSAPSILTSVNFCSAV